MTWKSNSSLIVRFWWNLKDNNFIFLLMIIEIKIYEWGVTFEENLIPCASFWSFLTLILKNLKSEKSEIWFFIPFSTFRIFYVKMATLKGGWGLHILRWETTWSWTYTETFVYVYCLHRLSIIFTLGADFQNIHCILRYEIDYVICKYIFIRFIIKLVTLAIPLLRGAI